MFNSFCCIPETNTKFLIKYSNIKLKRCGTHIQWNINSHKKFKNVLLIVGKSQMHGYNWCPYTNFF